MTRQHARQTASPSYKCNPKCFHCALAGDHQLLPSRLIDFSFTVVGELKNGLVAASPKSDQVFLISAIY
jgi:hypothetical protein